MSTPQLTDDVEGRAAPQAIASTQPRAAIDTPNKSSYIEKASAWNEMPLQPWRIGALVHSDKMYAVLERKELQFELLDWFEDARVGAVMRGEKIVSPGEFWSDLYRKSIGAIQQHFGELPVRVVDHMPAGKVSLVFGNKSIKSGPVKPQPSPITNKQPARPKKKFKARA